MESHEVRVFLYCKMLCSLGNQKDVSKPVDFITSKREQILNQKLTMEATLYFDPKKLVYQEKLVQYDIAVVTVRRFESS